MTVLRYLGVAALTVALTGCNTLFSSKKTEDNDGPFQGMSAKQLYTDGESYLYKKQYASAAKRFEAMESMYPFSSYAEKAQLDLIYSYYEDEQYAAAEATAERFIHLYPRSSHVDYAYYLKGMANFQQSRGTFAKVLPMDESLRDPGTELQAYSDFATLVERFPHSEYKDDALKRMIYLRNMFANRELHAAEFYYERKKYVAAIGRANYVVKNYQQAPASQEALAILYFANQKLGLKQASDNALKVYEATYHGAPKEPQVG